METTMSNVTRNLIFLLRLSIAWVFLYAASHQVFEPGWSATGFLAHTKTFNALFVLFTGPVIGPVVSFLVEYGHLLIGISLLLGAMVRASATAGIVLMILYWMAHMDFPYISNTNNFLMDEHVIIALVLGLLITTRAGYRWGMDGWLSNLPIVKNIGLCRWASS